MTNLLLLDGFRFGCLWRFNSRIKSRLSARHLPRHLPLQNLMLPAKGRLANLNFSIAPFPIIGNKTHNRYASESVSAIKYIFIHSNASYRYGKRTTIFWVNWDGYRSKEEFEASSSAICASTVGFARALSRPAAVLSAIVSPFMLPSL